MDYFIKKSQCCCCMHDLQAIKFRKIYRCKKCHLDVCSNCSIHRIWIYALENDFVKDYLKQQRVCDLCYKDYLLSQEYINTYGLKWNKRSLLYHKFIGKSDPAKPVLANYIPDQEIISKDVDTGRSDSHVFNYSMREFVSQCQQGIPQAQIRESIKRVLNLMVAHNPYIGYCQGMNQIAVFLLCLADEEGAFHLMAYLFDKIIPPRFYSSSSGAMLIGFQAEQYFLSQVIRGRDQEHWEKLCKFLELQAPQLLLTLFLQALNSSSVLVCWTEMFKNDSFSVMDNTLIYVLEQLRDLDLDKPGVIELLQQKIQHDQLSEHYKLGNVFFNEFEREIMLEQFYAQTSRQWVNDDKLIIFRLKKITNFDADEIKQIQKEFKQFINDSGNMDQPKGRQKRKSLIDENLTGSSDEENEIQLKQLQLEQTKLFKYGINVKNFIKLMHQFQEEYSGKVKFQNFEEIFNLFDEQKTGLLDFREFLICLSVLLRGSFEQRLRMFFSSHQKQLLTVQQFHTLLTMIIEEEHLQTQEFQDFLLRILKPTLSYLDMLQIAQDDFIQNLNPTKQRRDTCLHLANSLGQLHK